VLKLFSGFSATRIVFLGAGLLVVYFLASGAFNLVRSHQLSGEEARLQSEIDDLESRYERLRALEDYLNSDEYIEAVAREQLGLVKPGETAFIAIPTQPSPTPAAGESDLWWETLIR
jgi:cell division protein DivIC